MPVLVHDGRRPGHLGWLLAVLNANCADGAFISAFHTPRVATPRNRAASVVAAAVRDAGGEAIFDATTHGALLPGANDCVHYNTWNLWGPSGRGLDTATRRLEHLERVFERQQEIGAPLLAPTQTLDSPSSYAAHHAMSTALAAKTLHSGSWQSLAGRRSFWRAGSTLDGYVGQLVALRAPVWVVTVVQDTVLDSLPDLADSEAFEGWSRTIHSLSLRSRVVIAHGDYAGLPGVAAGADTIGTGWDRGMKFFDPSSFQLTAASPRTQASYVTHGNLAAVLRRDIGDVIASLGQVGLALRGGPMPPNDSAQREHHLARLKEIVAAIDHHGNHRRGRVEELRDLYDGAGAGFDYLQGAIPRLVSAVERRRWVEQPLAALEKYAAGEENW